MSFLPPTKLPADSSFFLRLPSFRRHFTTLFVSHLSLLSSLLFFSSGQNNTFFSSPSITFSLSPFITCDFGGRENCASCCFEYVFTPDLAEIFLRSHLSFWQLSCKSRGRRYVFRRRKFSCNFPRQQICHSRGFLHSRWMKDCC